MQYILSLISFNWVSHTYGIRQMHDKNQIIKRAEGIVCKTNQLHNRSVKNGNTSARGGITYSDYDHATKRENKTNITLTKLSG